MITENPLKQRYISALRKINDRIKGKRIIWAVVGSANLMLQEVPNIIPSDIDILTDRHGAYCFQSSLTDFCVVPIALKENDKYKSYYGKFRIEGVMIEIMGELQNKKPDVDLWGERNNFKGIKYIKIDDNMLVPVVPLKQEVIAYTAREKKDKVAILKKFLKKK